MNNTANISETQEPLMQLPFIATLLAIVAGSMDGYTYYTTQSFATFQSGNIIVSGYTFAIHNYEKLMPTLCSILCFAIGASITVMIRNWHNVRKKVWTYTIFGIEIVILLLISISSIHAVFLPIQITWILAFLAGMQGNAFHKIDNMPYGNVAVTLNLQLVASFLTEFFFKNNKSKRRIIFRKFLDYTIVLIGFAAGAAISAHLVSILGSYTLLFPVVVLIIRALFVKLLHKEESLSPIDSNN